MSARVEAVEVGNNEAEYCMMEEKREYLIKRERAFDGSYLVVAGLGIVFA